MSCSSRLFAVLVLGGMLATSAPSVARDPQVVAKEAASEVAAELAECAAYYAIAAQAIRTVPDKESEQAAIASERAGATALEMSAKLTAFDIAKARAELNMQTMSREMKNNWERFSIIASKHAFPCKDLLEGVDKRFVYWLGEKNKLPDVPPVPR